MFLIKKYNFSLWSCSCFLLTGLSMSMSVPGQPPHVVFIMADDMGWNDVSFHGSDQILTPNLDALAYTGVILQQYYSEAICTPARTALLTGKYPMRLGMQGFPLYNGEDRGIPLTERLLPSYMKEMGYATHLVGKWHVGMSRDDFLPRARGYDTHYGMRGGFVDYYTYNKVESWPDGRLMSGLDFFDNDIPQEEEKRYIVDALTDRAVKIIHSHNGSQPLFLHVTHNAPHSGNDAGALQPPLYAAVRNRHIANSDRRLYAEIVTHLDRSIGRIVRALADTDILHETMIVFVSDNGAPTVGNLRNWGVNLPLRGKKFSPWDGGVRVPAFVWYSSLKPKVWEGLMHITDWLPTLIAAAGGEVNAKIDGVNQWESIVKDKESKRKDVLVTVDNFYAAYRAGDFKVIVGNVTGVSNGYYGAELMANKGQMPDYYSSVRMSDVAKILDNVGYYFDEQDVEVMRSAATLKQQDTVVDETPCLPTPTRGCLYDLRRDPAESHDLWNRAEKIATMLTSRLRALWASQVRRGPTALDEKADPANFGYIWETWIHDSIETTNEVDSRSSGGDLESFNLSFNFNQTKFLDNVTTKASLVNCDGSSGIRNFLCILRSIF